jgi:hypothetical protein
VRVLVNGVSLACAAGYIALVIQCPVAVGASTRFGTRSIAPARAADPTAWFALVIVGTAVALAALGRISSNTPIVGIAVALCESRAHIDGAKRRDESEDYQASDCHAHGLLPPISICVPDLWPDPGRQTPFERHRSNVLPRYAIYYVWNLPSEVKMCKQSGELVGQQLSPVYYSARYSGQVYRRALSGRRLNGWSRSILHMA